MFERCRTIVIARLIMMVLSSTRGMRSIQLQLWLVREITLASGSSEAEK